MTVENFKKSLNGHTSGTDLIDYIDYMVLGAATCFRMKNYIDSEIDGENLILTQLDSHNNKIRYYIDINQIMIVKEKSPYQTDYENIMDTLLPPI